MKICFPVSENIGSASKVFGHFGSAPGFIVFDTEADVFEELFNSDRQHRPGACRPLKALGGTFIDAVVVGDIGAGALSGLNRAGLTVYRASGSTVAQNIEALREGRLTEITVDQVCAGHGSGH